MDLHHSFSIMFLACVLTLAWCDDGEVDEGMMDINSKRSDPEIHQDSSLEPDYTNEDKRWRFGSVLGKGFSFGKRMRLFANQARHGQMDSDAVLPDQEIEPALTESENARNNKKWVLSDIYFNKRSKRDTSNKRYFHYFGNVLGRGFSMGKRFDPRDTPALFDFPAADGFSDADDFNPLDKRRMFGSNRRRFFGSVLGGGFAMGKRDVIADEDLIGPVEDEADTGLMDAEDKRYFHSSPGYRFQFGKRSGDLDKRYGYLFGRPFSGGKRLFGNEDKKRRYGFVLGRGFSFGKRSSDGMIDNQMPDINDNFDDDTEDADAVVKRAGFILGRGYIFGKRGSKRFGWVLNNGRTLGKRSGDSQTNDDDDSIYFIGEDGVIYRIDDENIDILDTEGDTSGIMDTAAGFPGEGSDLEGGPVDKRGFGMILGRGYGFGKRTPSWKRFGHVLGGGLLGR